MSSARANRGLTTHRDARSVTGSEPLHDGIQIQAGSAIVRITAVRDDIVRVRIAAGSALPEDASWAVLAEARTKSVDVQPGQDAAWAGFKTATLDVRVERNPFRIVIRDLSGNVLSADAVGRPTTFEAGGFAVSKQMSGADHFFGLGDKTGAFDRKEQAYTLWNTDIGPQESVDPLYKSIPFFLDISGTRSYGIFLDNTWRTWFDFGKTARDAYSFGAKAGRSTITSFMGPHQSRSLKAMRT
jgi:Alpha-glucosidases, family 31 of glycosyl hydrolases